MGPLIVRQVTQRKSESLAFDKAVLTIKSLVAATQTPLIYKMSRMVLAPEVPT